MNTFTMHLRKAAAMLVLVAACVSAHADNPKRQFNVRKAARTALVPKVKSAVTPVPLKARPDKVSTVARDVLVDEDFSGFTSGTMNEPDTLNFLASSYYEPGIYIDPSLTKDGTWAGEYVHSAGGAAYLKTPNPMVPAALMTPLGDYSGEITVTCRVKAMPNWIAVGQDYETGDYIYGFQTGSSLNIYAGKGGYDSYEYADTDLGQYDVRLYENRGWTEVEVTFNNYSADNDGFICFYTEGAVLIDDIKVTTTSTFIASPKITGITDFKADGFTVEWEPVRKAYNYYIDLFKKVYTSDADGAFAEDFENFASPQEGWTVTSSEVADGEGADGGKGLVMLAGDTIVTPVNGATYKTCDFYLKFVSPDPMMSWASVNIDVQTNTGWENIGYYYGMGFEEGDVVRLADELEGFADKYTAVRITPVDLGEGEYIVVDDFDITTNRPSTLERVWGENSSMNAEDYGYTSDYNYYDTTEGLGETRYTFTGLEPEEEYYYAVRSHYVRQFSRQIIYHALGVSAPEAKAASDIDSRGSFTANWNAAPKATGYTVNLYGIMQAEEDTEDFVLLEEDFSKVDGSVTSATDWSQPDYLDNYDRESLDAYTHQPGWTGTGNTIAQGMLGCEYSGYYITDIVTPEIYVGNDEEVRIYLKAYGEAGDYLILMVNGQEYNIPFGTTADGTGLIDNTYILPVSSETIRPELYTLNYGAFMIDEIRFMQTLKKGDMVRTAVTSASTDGETTSYTFTNLADYGYGIYGYNVVSSFELEGESTTSAPSALVTVDLETGESEVTTGIEDATQGEAVSVVARYSLDGRLLTAPQRGVNILKMSDGTTRKVVVK